MHVVNGSNLLDMTIRPMTEIDLPEVADLENDIFPNPWPADSFRELLTDPTWGALVAVSGERVIGYTCYLTADAEFHLTNIAVAKPHRRKSVAKKLWERILQTVKREKCEYILLEVRPGNAGAIAFYEELGFQLMYRHPNYYRNPVEDALVMILYVHPDKEGN